MFINIPEFSRMEPRQMGAELERFCRELIAKINDELDRRPERGEIERKIKEKGGND